MSNPVEYRHDLHKKYSDHLDESGGIFTPATRKRLILSVDRQKYDKDFWYDVRNSGRNALVDLELLLDTADEKQIREIITGAKMKSLLPAILGMDSPDRPIPSFKPSYLRSDLPDPEGVEPVRFSRKQRTKLRTDSKFRRARLAEEFVDKGTKYFLELTPTEPDINASPSLVHRTVADVLGLIRNTIYAIRQGYSNPDDLRNLE